MAQTKRDIREILAAAGLNPLKRFGQNFLIDGNLMGKLVAAADVRRSDVVLEVGPGTGALTERLLEVSGHVVAMEIDRGLSVVLRERLAEAGAAGRFTLIEGDVLSGKTRVSAELLQVLADRAGPDRRIMMVANLPYQVATPLVVELLYGAMPITPLCFTVQLEVADRLTAPPGGKTYGPVGILVQAVGRVQRIARVPPTAFWPEPQVDSAMLRVDLREDQPSPTVRSRLVELVHGCFRHRRKTLRHNLRELLEASKYHEIESSRRWDLDDRPERLGVEAWIAMAIMLVSRKA